MFRNEHVLAHLYIGSIMILVTTMLIFIVCLSDIIIMARLFEVTAISPRVLTERQVISISADCNVTNTNLS